MSYLNAKNFRVTYILKLFTLYIWFALFFYLISFLGGGGIKFREGIPWYVLISRDIVWLGFVTYLIYCIRRNSFWHQLWMSDYGKFLKIFTILCGIYLIIVLSHLIHRDLREIIQHDIRNILSYSLIIFFLPLIIQKKEDIYSLMNTLLKVGMVLSLFGIVTRFMGLDFLTWRGRVVSTMSDPNNLGIFLSFCILLVVINWKSLSIWKAVLYFLIYSFALVLTNSITAFLTINFALFVILLLKKGWIKGFAIFFAVFYLFICLSFVSKIVENPDILYNNFFIETYDKDKYLIDRLNNISKGKFSKWFLFGIDYQVQDETMRSLTYRKAQFFAFAGGKNTEVKETEGVNKLITLFGNYKSKEYATFDNQYFNFLFNAGIVSTLIFFSLFTWGVVRGIINYLNFHKVDKDLAMLSLFFSVFLLTMILVAFNGAAFLNRFPLNFLIYFSLGMIFLIKEIQKGKWVRNEIF